MDPTLLVAGSILLFAVPLLVTAALGRYLFDPAVDGAGADRDVDLEEAVDRDAETVTCPECGAENELGYAYCANCVAELPGAVAWSSRPSGPNRRGIF